MNIYVANLHPHIDEDHLKKTFSPFGEIESAKIIIDLETGESKGYGFVSMPNDDHAKNAISNLSGSSVLGDFITVREANPPGAKHLQKNQNRPRNHPSPRSFDNQQNLVTKEGKVKFFNDAKGYGFIVCEEKDIFFQRNALANPHAIPQNEQPVEFKTKTTPRGKSAFDIILK
ncbi:MAG: cold shock domain-containing protein [Bacteroidales bacterium]|jgi:RNA recognition motif-containing protein|nr:cold shock domain-containing protein [Bacteroidales bacterium]